MIDGSACVDFNVIYHSVVEYTQKKKKKKTL
jgi:hypothetical protein